MAPPGGAPSGEPLIKHGSGGPASAPQPQPAPFKGASSSSSGPQQGQQQPHPVQPVMIKPGGAVPPQGPHPPQNGTATGARRPPLQRPLSSNADARD